MRRSSSHLQAVRRKSGSISLTIPLRAFDCLLTEDIPTIGTIKEGRSYVTVWGTGTPRREFLHVDDLADACLFLMANYDENEPINIGTGEDLPIAELAAVVQAVVDYRGAIEYDTTKPDGTPRKLLDVSRLRNLGWRPRIGLEEGLRNTYAWYRRYW